MTDPQLVNLYLRLMRRIERLTGRRLDEALQTGKAPVTCAMFRAVLLAMHQRTNADLHARQAGAP